MTDGAAWAAVVGHVLLAVLTLALLLTLVRVVRGPGLPDRAVAVGLVSEIAAGILVLYAVVTDSAFLLLPAVTLALVAFLEMVALAVLLKGRHAAGPGRERA